jgi:DNA polymerase-3 subunit alpha
MQYLFFDTETTGFPVGDVQPNLVSIAWMLTDEEGRLLSSEYHIVYPKRWTIPEASTAIHKITTQTARRDGKALEEVLIRFQMAALRADLLVAHNMRFDKNVINAALKLMNSLPMESWNKPFMCTMNYSKNLVKVIGKTGKIKLPKLQELFRFGFGIDPYHTLHNALGDTDCLKMCFFKVVLPSLQAAAEVSTNAADAPVTTTLELSLGPDTSDL